MSTDPSLLATPEELAARHAAAGPVSDTRTAYEKLAGAHAPLSDDELAGQIEAHPDRDVLLALWRRVRGQETTAVPEPVTGPG
jgi:hypothetical protein